MNLLHSKIGFIAISAIVLICLPVGDLSAKAGRAVRKRSRSAHVDSLVIVTGQRIKIKTTGGAGKMIEGVFAGKEGGFLTMIHGGDIRLDSVTTKDSVTYVFCREGAVYEPEADLVSGPTDNNEHMAIPLDDIDYIHVTLTDDYSPVHAVINADTARQRLGFRTAYPRVDKVAIDSIGTLYVWQKGKNKGNMMGIGAVTGLAIGIIIGYSEYNAHRGEIISMPFMEFFIPSLLCTLAGAAIFWALAPNESWEKVSLAEARFGVAPLMNGAPGLKVAFRIPL